VSWPSLIERNTPESILDYCQREQILFDCLEGKYLWKHPQSRLGMIRKVFEERMDGLTFREIGEKNRFTVDRAQQYYNKALDLLSHESKLKRLI
jgi:DNA-directed RNA polymerase sigma subunit (sigma70/sigma32)